MSDPAAGGPSSPVQPSGPTGSAGQLLARLQEEQRQGWRRGEHVLVEAYLERYPALRNDAECILDLLYNEFVAREECGQSPRPEEYCARFPALASLVRAQLQLHQAFSPEGLSGANSAHEVATVNLAGQSRRGTTGPAPSIPGYEVLAELGRGGMGVVYKAWQLRLERVVAVKMILSGASAGPQELARFRTEAQSAARLQHPNIVQVHEVGEHDGRPYLTLEYVDGGSLDQRLGGRPMSAGPAAQLVRTLARAMHYAHGRRVVHRDLKPANVLLTADGTPKITDFGLARCLGSGAAQTQTDAILGTPSYIAPEQAGGRCRQVGPATDVYALGAILYELLTGRPPFLAENALDILEQVRAQEPVPPARLRPRVPRDLETICLKCLRKEPEGRYASAAGLAEDLERFLSDRPIRARRTGLPARSWRWCRRNPVVAGLLGSVATLLVMITVGSAVSAVMTRRARDEARDNLNQALNAQAETDELWDAYLMLMPALRSGPQAGQRHRGLETLTKVAARRSSLRLRNEAIALMTLTDLREAKKYYPKSGEGWPGMDVDAELEHYATSDRQGTISVCRVADNKEINRWSAAKEDPAWVLVFSPDGKRLAAKYHPEGDEGRNQVWLRVWEVEKEKPLLEEQFDMCDKACAFSPDGRWLAAGRKDGGVYRWDLRGGGPPKRLAEVAGPLCLVFQPGGRRLAVFSAANGEVQVLDADTGSKVFPPLSCPARVNALAWHPEGNLLAAACGNDPTDQFPVYVWDTTVPRPGRLVLRGHSAEVRGVAFSHGGDLLASVGWGGSTRLWDPRTGRQLVNDCGTGGERVQFGPRDGALGTVGARGFNLWDVATGRECRALYGHTGYKGPWCVDFSPDARLLASAGHDGVRLWDVATARGVALLPGRQAESVRFDPTGRGLIASGGSGVFRWPIVPEAGDPGGGLPAGPPRSLLPGWHYSACLGPGGRPLAVADRAGGQVILLDPADPAAKAALGLAGAKQVAIDPHGRWVAAGSCGEKGVRVWDLQTRELVKELGTTDLFLAFSPDGQWLVTSTRDEYHFWTAGSWEAGHTVRVEKGLWNPLAFTPDGRLLAVTSNYSSVRLIESSTGREVATLTAPDPQPITWLCFSPDGSQLAVATVAHVIHLWDLRRIRQQLAGMNLDWRE